MQLLEKSLKIEIITHNSSPMKHCLYKVIITINPPPTLNRSIKPLFASYEMLQKIV